MLLRELTSKQFSEWLVWYSIEPFGDQRADLRAGIIAATMSNRWRGKHEQPSEPIDFMPFHRRHKQTPDEMKALLRGVLRHAAG